MHARARTHAITKSELLYSFLATVKQFLQRNSNSTAVVRPQLFTRIAKYTSTKAGMTPRDLSRVQWPVQSTRSSHGSKLWKHQAVLSSQLSAWNYDEKTLSLLASEAARSKCNTTVGSSAHCKPMAIISARLLLSLQVIHRDQKNPRRKHATMAAFAGWPHFP